MTWLKSNSTLRFNRTASSLPHCDCPINSKDPVRMSKDGKPSRSLRFRTLAYSSTVVLLVGAHYFTILTKFRPYQANVPGFSAGTVDSKPLIVEIGDDFTVTALPLVWDYKLVASQTIEEGTIPGPYIERSLHRSQDNYPEECIPLKEWHSSLHPACSLFHEIDLVTGLADYAKNESQVEVVGRGMVRHVWMAHDYSGVRFALKTVRKSFSSYSMFKHRQDALLHEALSSSEYIAPIYGFCATSAIHDFSTGHLGQLLEEKEHPPSDEERLRLAHRLVSAVADVHNEDSLGRATSAMTDIKPDNFFLGDGGYVMSDFNRARFLRWNVKTNEHCGFTFASNKGRWRSPEEYLMQNETEKVDLFSTGLMLYSLLTWDEPFGTNMTDKQVKEYVREGGRPRVTDATILNSTNPIHQVMLQAVDRCLAFNPKARPSARQVEQDLHGVLLRLGIIQN